MTGQIDNEKRRDALVEDLTKSALQGLLSNPHITAQDLTHSDVASMACDYAIAALHALDQMLLP